MKLRFSIRDLLWLTLLCGVLLAWWIEHRKYAPFMETHARYLKWKKDVLSGQAPYSIEMVNDWQSFCFSLEDDLASLEWANKELKRPHKADGRYEWAGTEQNPMMLDTATGILWRQQHSGGHWYKDAEEPGK